MGVVVRQSIFTSIISYAGAVIGYVNLLYLFPKFLDPEQVGLLRTVQDAAILFSPFAQFGLSQSIIRFYPQLAKDKPTQSGFISLILLLALVGFGIFLVVFYSFENSIILYFDENAGAVISYVAVILWLTLIMLLITILESYSRSLLRTVFPNMLRELGVRALLAISVTAYFFGWLSFNAFIISTVVAYLICLLALIVYLVVNKELSLSTHIGFMGRTKLRELLLYSLFSLAGAAGIIVIAKIDSLMIAAMLGLQSVAVYTTAYYMASVIEIPKKALSAITMPLVAQAFEKNNIADIERLYSKTALNQLIVGSLLLTGIWINLDSIYELMPRKEIYAAGSWVIVLVGIGKLADMAFGPSSEIVVLSKYYWFNFILLILLAGTTIAINLSLIPVYGINGAAAGVAFALIMFNLVKYIFLRLALKIQPFSVQTLIVLAIGAATVGLNLLIPRIPYVLLDIMVRSGIVTLFFGSMILWTKVSPDANQLFKSILHRIGF